MRRGENPIEDMAWPPRVLESYPLSLLLMGKEKVPLLEEPGLLGAVSLGDVISPASTASETVSLEPITTPEDEAAIALCDRQMSNRFVKSLAVSYREGALTCILDIVETYPDYLLVCMK